MTPCSARKQGRGAPVSTGNNREPSLFLQGLTGARPEFASNYKGRGRKNRATTGARPVPEHRMWFSRPGERGRAQRGACNPRPPTKQVFMDFRPAASPRPDRSRCACLSPAGPDPGQSHWRRHIGADALGRHIGADTLAQTHWRRHIGADTLAQTHGLGRSVRKRQGHLAQTATLRNVHRASGPVNMETTR